MVVGPAHPALREQKRSPAGAAAAAPQVGAHPVGSRGAARGDLRLCTGLIWPVLFSVSSWIS